MRQGDRALLTRHGDEMMTRLVVRGCRLILCWGLLLWGWLFFFLYSGW